MIAEQYQSVFGTAAAIEGFTPGRVNIIGEHTDYNGGMVLPAPINLGVHIALSPRQDDQIEIWSDQFKNNASRSISEAAIGHWSDYISGAVIYANQQGYLSGGVDIAVTSTLPHGAGISSSAAITVGILKIARDLANSSATDQDIALLAQRIENEYIGLPCGIMDQMVVAVASPGQAMALATDTLQYELIDLPQNYHFAVIHSGHYRQLSESGYRVRKEECDQLKQHLGHDNLCQISDADLQGVMVLSEPLPKRAKHCVTEHRRTLEAAACLESGEMQRLAQLMNESHVSMRDDFEITLPEIDQLVADAVTLGAIGARQTGGGFGGCIVALVERQQLASWTEALLEKYPKAFSVC